MVHLVSRPATPRLRFRLSLSSKIGMSLKVMETEGKKIRAALINLDLTGRWWHHDDGRRHI